MWRDGMQNFCKAEYSSAAARETQSCYCCLMLFIHLSLCSIHSALKKWKCLNSVLKIKEAWKYLTNEAFEST